jgi:hypothetical protein
MPSNLATKTNSGASEISAADSHRRAAYAQLCMVAECFEPPPADLPFEELRQSLRDRLRAAWGKDGFRLTYVHIENVNAAFVHATIAVMDTDEVKLVWPYWTLQNPMDERTSRICDALVHTVRPAGEWWWYAGHIPPLHFNCRSIIEGLSLKEAHRQGITTYYPVIEPEHGFGYTDREWQPDLSKFPPELTAIYDQAVRQAGEASLNEDEADLLFCILTEAAVL